MNCPGFSFKNISIHHYKSVYEVERQTLPSSIYGELIDIETLLQIYLQLLNCKLSVLMLIKYIIYVIMLINVTCRKITINISQNEKNEHFSETMYVFNLWGKEHFRILKMQRLCKKTNRVL